MVGRFSASGNLLITLPERGRRFRFGRFTLAVIFGPILANSAHSQTWDGDGANGGNVNWSFANNWNPNGVPASNGTANLIMAGTIDTTNNIDVNFDINSLTFNGSAGAFTILGLSTLTIRGGGITNQSLQTQSFGNPSSLILGANQTWNAASGGLSFVGLINLGTNQLTVTGGLHILTINGGIQNTTGSLVLSAPFVQLGGDNLHTGGTILNGGTVTVLHNGAAGTGTLTLNGGAIAVQNPKTLPNAVTLGGNFGVGGGADISFSGAATLTGDRTIAVGNSGGTTFSGAIGQDIAGRRLVKSGTSTLTFSGGSANTYSGETFVAEGTLLLNKTAGVNAIAGNTVTVGDAVGGVDADVLRLAASNQIVNTATVNLNAAGLFDLNGFSETIDTLGLNGGRATTGTGTLTLTNGLNFQGSGTTSTLSGNLNLNGGIRTFNILDGVQPTDVDISAVIGSGSVLKTGPGTILFSGGLPNTYTGTTTVAEGQLVLGKMGANGTILGNLVIGDGLGPGTDQVIISAANQIANSANVTINSAVLTVSASEDGFGLLTLNEGTVIIGAVGSLTLANDVVVNSTIADNAISGLDRPLNLGGTRTFTVNDSVLINAELTTSTAIQGGTLVKNGLGSMSLTGGVANTVGATINAGRLIADKNSNNIAALTGNIVIGDGLGGVDADILQTGDNEQLDQSGSDTLTINSSGLLDLNGNDESVGHLIFNGGRVVSGELRFVGNDEVTVNANAQTATIGSSMFLDGVSNDFVVANGAAAIDLNITGSITAGTISKSGAGTMQLTNTAGSTAVINVNEGTVLLANSSSSAIQGTLSIGDGIGAQGADVARLLANNQLADNAVTVSVQSSGLLDLNGFSDTVGALYLTAGTITTGAGTLSLDQFIETFAHPLTSSVAGNVGLGSAPRSFNVHDGAAVIDLDVTATITAGAGGQLLKEGAGTMRLSGTQNVPIVLNAGTLAAAFTIGPNGSLTQNAGATVSGTLTNQGAYTYNGGTFAGQLINEGTATLGASFTAGNGVINFGTLAFGASQSLTTNGAGLNNQGTITLTGGTLGGNGPLINNTVLSGRGTIAGSAGFANNGLIDISGGNVSLTNSGANTNAGLVTVPFGLQLRLLGGNLTNSGIIDLDGGSINGSATLVNAAGGTVEGGSSVQSPMTNNGGLIHANAGSTLLITNLSGGNINGGELRIENSSGINVTSAFASSGTIVLLGADAQLSDGAVANTGILRGLGRATNTVLNSGTVLAEGGRLTLSGSGHTNAAAGIIEAGAAAEVFYSQGLAANAGQIALVGGTFDNNNRTLANSGSVAGDGVIRTGGLTNTGSIGVGGGDLDLIGPVTNNSTVSIQSGSTARFFGPVNGPGNYTGTGTTMFLNSFSPGASPAQVSFGGDLVLGGTATLNMELAGTTPGSQYDRLAVAGSVSLAGALNVLLLDGFTPTAGNAFEIIAATGGIIGTFTGELLPTLGANLQWDVLYGSNAVTLQVSSTLLIGDYNQNGIIDAADYVVFRKNEGTTNSLPNDPIGGMIGPAQYGLWREHFGETIGSGAASPNAAIPEPASLAPLVLAAAIAMPRLRRRVSPKLAST